MNELTKSETHGIFCVVWWDFEYRYHYEKKFCGPKEAVDTARDLTWRAESARGTIKRIAIVNSTIGNHVEFDWQDGKVLFPPRETYQSPTK